MSDAKNEMLNTIRRALAGVPEQEKAEDIEVPRGYRQKGKLLQNEIVHLFAESISEYRATVKRVKEKDLTKAIGESFQREEVNKIVIPEGFPSEWLPASATVLADTAESPLSHNELDESDGVVTTCALAVAQTGTIFLDAGKGQGRRVLTLLPDYHLCIVRESQIVELIPEGFSALELSVREERRPVTLISGPSATSDIELSRVEGVHGPRRLEVLILTDD